MADAQRGGRDARAGAGVPERPERGTEGGQRVPWRVEGARRGTGQPAAAAAAVRAAVLDGAAGAAGAQLGAVDAAGPAPRTHRGALHGVPGPGGGGQRPSVTGIEDAIDGQFKKPVRVPVDDQTQEVTRFSTRRPSFAADDNLWALLTDHDVEVDAESPPGPSLLERVLLGFGPTLLLVGLFVLLARRAASGRGGRGRPRRLWPLPGPPLRARDRPARHLRGRGRHRRRRGRGGRDRRLPQEPRPLPQARGHGPQGGAAGRAAGDRQDPARPGRGRRGRACRSSSCRPRSSSR